VHLHLSLAHPSCDQLEYIPWMRHCFEEPATVSDGCFVAPRRPGAGTSLLPSALQQHRVG
jgi:L-alanine-DL-glutamate epimerase-like enolase superfamily enzyme